MEKYFEEFRKNIIGINSRFESPYGIKPLIYSDWTATGRLYKPIEDTMVNSFGVMNGNTHSLSSKVGQFMTESYEESLNIIKDSVGGNDKDVVLSCGGGMTAAIYKLINILELEKYNSKNRRAIVFISHLEHNSNYLPWVNCGCNIVVVPPNNSGEVSVQRFENEIRKHRNNPYKIVSVTACSNVTGCKTCYTDIANVIHRYGGVCFVDCAAMAPYGEINMNPNGKNSVDAVFFSAHKFLGGPGSSGILVFNKRLYSRNVPTNPAGGTVEWVASNGNTIFNKDIVKREDAGTPLYLQSIRAALAMKLKEKMGTQKIKVRENQILEKVLNSLEVIDGIELVENKRENRQPIISFISEKIHYNLFVKQLSDRFGIQSRGGCSCAGLLGEKVFKLRGEKSMNIYKNILNGNRTSKPGWVRLSFHPTTTNDEIEYICKAVRDIADKGSSYSSDYIYIKEDNEFRNVLEKKYPIKNLFKV